MAYRTLIISLMLGVCVSTASHAQVSTEVYPRVAVVNPYRRTTFRFQWRIEPHEDNRRYALVYSCGAELHSSQGGLNGNSRKTTERYVELTVLTDCEFMACVVRMVEGKPKTTCSWAYVRTEENNVLSQK